jgi:hypothetical protein
MKLRYVFVLNAIVSLIFAVGFLLAPKTMLSLFHLSVGSTVSFNASINFMTQLLGAALIAHGLLSWFAGGMTEANARRSVATSLFVFQVIGFALSLLGMLSKIMSVTGWVLVGLFLLFALGYAYFLFVKQSEI